MSGREGKAEANEREREREREGHQNKFFLYTTSPNNLFRIRIKEHLMVVEMYMYSDQFVQLI